MEPQDRPYFNHSHIELKQIFNVSKNDKTILESLLHELEFRSTRNTYLLRMSIEKTLKEIDAERLIFIDNKYNDQYSHTCFFDYHPKRGGRNPCFDELSQEILNLKNYQEKAIQYFYLILDPLLNKGFPITAVPSGNPNKTSSGIILLAKKLAMNDRVDATSCLRRQAYVPKKSHGGIRSLALEFESIEVINNHLIQGKNVMLLDDVRTSGVSLQACSMRLKEAGAKYVKQVSLAQTV